MHYTETERQNANDSQCHCNAKNSYPDGMDTQDNGGTDG